jgi:hypothetical protein
MQTKPLDVAFELFTEDALSEDGLGFPNRSAYVADEGDAKTARTVWRNLEEGHPAILVGLEEPVMLIEQIQPGPWGRLRNRLLGRMTVRLSYYCRSDGAQPPFRVSRSVRAELDRGSPIPRPAT